MSIPKSEQFPDEQDNLPPARRRRAQRGLIPDDLKSEVQGIDALARETIPTFDFFLFSLFSAAILTVGILVNAPALLVLGVLAAPPLTPFIGIALGAATGSIKFFLQRLIGSLIAGGFVFLVGILGGYTTPIFQGIDVQAITHHAQLTWPHLLLLIVGTLFTIQGVTRKENSPLLSSVALAYELYIPLAIAGVGLGSGLPYLWPDGLVVFGIHLAVLAITGMLVFLVVGIRPLSMLGYTLGSVISILSILGVIILSGMGAVFGGNIAIPTPIPTATTTPTPLPPTNTPTNTPLPPTITPSPTVPTATPTLPPTATSTITPKPTPMYGEINASGEYGGATIRSDPDTESSRVITLLNGHIVEILDPNPQTDDLGRNWLNVRYQDQEGAILDGWVLENALLVATPVPNW